MLKTKIVFKSVLLSGLFLAANVASAHGDVGLSKIVSGMCFAKPPLTGTVIFNANVDDQTKVSYHVGSINPVNPGASAVASGVGKTSRLLFFPNDMTETLRIELPASVAKAVGRPTLTLLAKVRTANDEIPALGFLTDTMSEIDNFDLECRVGFAQAADDKKAIDLNLTRPSKQEGMCSIEVYQVAASKWDLGCSGTLVSPNKVLSAAHCVEFFKAKPLRIKCQGDSQVFEVADWKMNRDYRPANHPVDSSKDISVLTLEGASTAKPVGIELDATRARAMILGQAQCKHFGFGMRSDGIAGRLFEANYGFPADVFGGRTFVEYIMKQNGMIASDPERFVRNGDSGGPIVCDDNGSLKVVAVHSFLSAMSASAYSAVPADSREFVESNLNAK